MQRTTTMLGSRALVTRALRRISTSGKRSDTVVAPAGAAARAPFKAEDFAETATKNWQSYGFDRHDRVADENHTHAAFFHMVTLGLVLGGFILAYRPNGMMRDWTCREAFLELRRREELGLPAIDANYVDPDSIVLPDEEDLKDVEIII